MAIFSSKFYCYIKIYPYNRSNASLEDTESNKW